MARKRTSTPNKWTPVKRSLLDSPRFLEISDDGRLLYVTLLLIRDDNGVIPAIGLYPRSVGIYGWDKARFDDALAELAKVDLLVTFEADGREYYLIQRNFACNTGLMVYECLPDYSRKSPGALPEKSRTSPGASCPGASNLVLSSSSSSSPVGGGSGGEEGEPVGGTLVEPVAAPYGTPESRERSSGAESHPVLGGPLWAPPAALTTQGYFPALARVVSEAAPMHYRDSRGLSQSLREYAQRVNSQNALTEDQVSAIREGVAKAYRSKQADEGYMVRLSRFVEEEGWLVPEEVWNRAKRSKRTSAWDD